jgi:hypothetical protein
VPCYKSSKQDKGDQARSYGDGEGFIEGEYAVEDSGCGDEHGEFVTCVMSKLKDIKRRILKYTYTTAYNS